MPELPEAEIARRRLERRWTGPLVAVHLLDPAVVRRRLSSRPSDRVERPLQSLEVLRGSSPTAFLRHGKRIGLCGRTWGLLLHLGMSGKVVRGREPPRHGRLGLETVEGTLWLVDPRRFACVVPVEPDGVGERLRAGLGPDALAEPVDAATLGERLGSRRPVKVALMDQRILAGIGNIQAAEILFRARIDPRLPCAALGAERMMRLARAIPAQLAHAIRADDRDDLRYLAEGGPNRFRVYGREGQPCPRCGGSVARMRLRGRSTYWCPRCVR